MSAGTGPVVTSAGGQARFLLALIGVALGAAAFAIVFRESLNVGYRVFFGASGVVDAIQQLPLLGRLMVAVLGALAAGTLATRAKRNQGVGNVMEAVALGHVHLSLRATSWRSAGSWLAIASGMSIGREGPLIEMGGSLGAWLAGRLRLPLDQLRVLVAAGTAAGFGAAYNTPFAAILFVLETVVGIAALDALLPTIVSTVVATSLTRYVAGAGPIYGARAFSLSGPADLLQCALLGGVAALVALGFKASLGRVERLFARLTIGATQFALGGAIVGVVAMGLPEVAGNGYEVLNRVLDHALTVPFLLALLVLKIVATSASVGSGIPGGIFTPVLLVGGVVGALWGELLHWMNLTSGASVGSFALVGMAATAAASTHAPLTAAVMVFELSGDYPIVLPLLIATSVSTTLSRWLGSESVYTSELRRRGIAWELTLEGRETRHSVTERRPCAESSSSDTTG